MYKLKKRGQKPVWAAGKPIKYKPKPQKITKVMVSAVSAAYSPPLSLSLSLSLSSSFGFKKFEGGSEYLWSRITLVGDAAVDGNGSYVRLSGPWNYSSGTVMYKHPLTFTKNASFGTYFVFSVGGGGGVVAFEIVPRGGLIVELEVETRGGEYVIVRIKLGGQLVKVKVFGEKLQCWIDFEASSKRVEVRVNKWGVARPNNATVFHLMDLDLDLPSRLLSNQGVFVALSSRNVKVNMNTNTTGECRLYSWSFKIRRVPTWMHSQPLDPQGLRKKGADEVVVVTTTRKEMMHRRGDCIVRLVTALVFGTGCGAMGAFIVLCVWSVFVTKRPSVVVPEECVVDYEKVKVVVIDSSKSDDNAWK
ncbi:hypothetical protein vseg_017335 [Gypsophila vaccaria]